MGQVEVLFLLLERAWAFAEKVKAARAEGRTLTEAEIEEFYQSYLASDAELSEAIERAKAEGR